MKFIAEKLSLTDATMLVKKTTSQMSALEVAYQLVTKRFYGARAYTYLLFWRLFWSNKWAWQHPGFLQCTGQNQLLRFLLLESGAFKKTEIKRVWTVYWLFSPHQYLKVKVDGKWVAVDAWACHVEKLHIGEHAGR